MIPVNHDSSFFNLARLVTIVSDTEIETIDLVFRIELGEEYLSMLSDWSLDMETDFLDWIGRGWIRQIGLGRGLDVDVDWTWTWIGLGRGLDLDLDIDRDTCFGDSADSVDSDGLSDSS